MLPLKAPSNSPSLSSESTTSKKRGGTRSRAEGERIMTTEDIATATSVDLVHMYIQYVLHMCTYLIRNIQERFKKGCSFIHCVQSKTD